MIRRILFLFFLLVTVFSVLANRSGITIDDNSIRYNLDKIKQIIQSKEWVPADTSIDRQLRLLINYLGNPPVDSVVAEIDKILDNREIIIARDYQRIKNPELVKGYVPQTEITRRIKEIGNDLAKLHPVDEIEVPEVLIEEAYKSLRLIGENEIERMINDSLYSFPDSIMAIIGDPETEENDSLRSQLDTLCSQLLEDARNSYNQSLIETCRDSVIGQYHDSYLQNLISKAQNAWLDSVYTVNNKIIARYNDSETLKMNKELKQELLTLLEYLKKTPNELTVVNYNNEQSTFDLRNGESWYQWIYLKNSQNDSIGIRIENIDKHTVRMLVDESVNLSRLDYKDGIEVQKIKPSQKNELTLSKFNTRKPELSPWKLVGKAYAGFTQNYINPYWSQGGKSSASALSTFNYAANYSKNKLIWESFADLKLGVIFYLPEDGVVAHRNWHKNSDSFELNSRLGLSAAKKWYYSTEANFKTQLFNGYSNQNDTIPSSGFLSPAYLTFSLGMEYKPCKEFSAFLSPISLKTTYVTNPLVDETKFGLPKGEIYRSRVGISGKVDYSKSLLENVALKTKNSVFINFGNNNAGEWQFLKLPDFDSETAVDFKVNQFITTQVNFHLIYDKDLESSWVSASGEKVTGTRLQVKEFFTLGISYKF